MGRVTIISAVIYFRKWYFGHQDLTRTTHDDVDLVNATASFDNHLASGDLNDIGDTVGRHQPNTPPLGRSLNSKSEPSTRPWDHLYSDSQTACVGHRAWRWQSPAVSAKGRSVDGLSVGPGGTLASSSWRMRM